jgi:hypothetical protein
VHKPGVPLRPIISYVGSPGYETATFLSGLLEPLRKKQYQIKNVYDLKEKTEKLTIEDDEEIVSFDVIGLFPSVPINKVLDIIRCRLKEDKSLSDRTKLSVDDIMDLLTFILRSTAFRYNNGFYEQITGVPMGSPVSVVVAELMMEHLEDEAMKTDKIPTWYGRFVDDCVAKLKQANVQPFHDTLNDICPEIQFTVEHSKNGVLPFLDGLIVRKGQQLEIQVYRKPTHSNRYLDFESDSPLEHKRAVVTTLLHRALTVPTTDSDKKQEVSYVKTALQQNGYPKKFIDNQLAKMKNGRQRKDQREEQCAGFAVLPYVRGLTERIQRVLRRTNVKVAVSSKNTLRRRLDRLKDSISPDDERGVIYRIPCSDCNSVYVGQTSCARRTRVNQHEADCRYKRRQKSELAEHHVLTGHRIGFDKVTTLTREPDYRKRIWKESWSIVHTQSALNQKTEVIIPAQFHNM